MKFKKNLFFPHHLTTFSEMYNVIKIQKTKRHLSVGLVGWMIHLAIHVIWWKRNCSLGQQQKTSVSNKERIWSVWIASTNRDIYQVWFMLLHITYMFTNVIIYMWKEIFFIFSKQVHIVKIYIILIMYTSGFLHSSKDDYLAFWIGANSRTDGEGFKWSNGAPFVFYNWFPGNPI